MTDTYNDFSNGVSRRSRDYIACVVVIWFKDWVMQPALRLGIRERLPDCFFIVSFVIRDVYMLLGIDSTGLSD